MGESRKSGLGDKLLGLVIITGFMLLLMALPMGLWLSMLGHSLVKLDWFWTVIGGVAMTITLTLVGGVFLWTGEFIVQRRRKSR